MHSPEAAVAYRYLVTGRVQGVFFRKCTRERALTIGVEGWVRNLASGEVEVAALGTPDQHAALERFLWEGPERAEVTSVTRAPCPDELGPGFEIV